MAPFALEFLFAANVGIGTLALLTGSIPEIAALNFFVAAFMLPSTLKERWQS